MQRELFEMSGPVVDASKFSVSSHKNWLDRFQVTVRVDHLFILGISVLVFYVLVFSFGVEKGKRFALDELRAEKKKREQISQELATLKLTPRPVETVLEVRKTVEPALPKSTVAGPQEEGVAFSPDSGKFTIQLVTYKSRVQADQQIERLTSLGYKSFFIQSGKFYQVCVEAFETNQEAVSRLARLQQEGFAPPDAYIRPLTVGAN
ncbi:MAG: SPOR domain-containing protein [Candidatus Omnitrophica bacterium]|nr:SPOR domain-containing protein [Candidatus Omnitrophota bacterium]